MVPTRQTHLPKIVLLGAVAGGSFLWGLMGGLPAADPAVPAASRPPVAVEVPAPVQHGARLQEEVEQAPFLLQLFRPNQETARALLRSAMPLLAAADGTLQHERQGVTVYGTSGTAQAPQTLFQTTLPFLRPPMPEPQAEPPSNPAVPPPTAVEASPNPPEPEAPQVRPVLGGVPLVGIYHTHDWESYLSEFPGLAPQTQADLDKVVSYDHKKRTVVTLGSLLAQELSLLGVTPAHAEHRHSHHTYAFAYRGSRDTARKILKEAPTTQVLIDIHRDGVLDMDFTTTISGERVAQIRCIIGGNNPAWEKNYATCEELRGYLEQVAPGISLPTRVQENNIYNQDLLPGAILLEIGNAPNHYEEAERATRFLAQALAEMIRARE